MPPPEDVIKEWARKQTYIENTINKLNKRLKKYEKKKKHFEMRLRLLKEYKKKANNTSA